MGQRPQGWIGAGEEHDPAPLERFRAQISHGVLGRRRDALFDQTDPLSTGDAP